MCHMIWLRVVPINIWNFYVITLTLFLTSLGLYKPSQKYTFTIVQILLMFCMVFWKKRENKSILQNYHYYQYSKGLLKNRLSRFLPYIKPLMYYLMKIYERTSNCEKCLSEKLGQTVQSSIFSRQLNFHTKNCITYTLFSTW